LSAPRFAAALIVRTPFFSASGETYLMALAVFHPQRSQHAQDVSRQTYDENRL
jgi:hypothetical protein